MNYSLVRFFLHLNFSQKIIYLSFTNFSFYLAEAAAKKGGKGGKKDRSPSAKKGSAKAGGKKGKKGNELPMAYG